MCSTAAVVTERGCPGGFHAMQKCVVITNNSALYQTVSSGHFIEGSSLDVLISVRDSVHLGSCLLTHPLCGNLRPYQQPFRSILIQKNPGALVDLQSLTLIEEAVLVYRSCEKRLLLPDNLPAATREDYAFVDFELMKESLQQYGLLPKSVNPVFHSSF